MCASCQLPCSDANPPWLVPTGNWAQTGAKQTQEGNMAHGNPLSLSPSLSLALSLSSRYPLSLSHLQFSRQIFVLLQMVGSHSLIQAGSSCSLLTALWTVRGINSHRGCRAVAEFKSRAGICASKLSNVSHCVCSVSTGWPCEAPTCWDSSEPKQKPQWKRQRMSSSRKSSFELVKMTRWSCRNWEG